MRINVVYGANTMDNFELNGSSLNVKAVRTAFSGSFGIPSDAKAFVNAVEKPETHILSQDDTIEFKKATGSKG